MKTLHDSPPWYRHRWPWLLMAGPAVVVVAGIVTTWIAVATSDGLVADDYYKQGLAVNQKLARVEAAAALRLEARLRLAAGRIEIGLASAAAAPLPARLRVTLAHPTRGGEDQKLVLAGERGVYAGPLAALGPGRWQVAIEDEAGTWRLAGSVQLPDAPVAVFTAGSTR
ncbi:MAG: FixH family protein [Rhodocyclaceae bacterium]|jgi:hypothetical protein|nr:FixH family protein [Rhodocyclaceae bacterium]MCC6878556.1 FixH family protein [Rhodocyclaceae bacterium]